jgi:electron transport complex protein RnfG
MNEHLKYISALTIICLVTASLLTAVYLLTRPNTIAQKEKAQEEALQAVLPEAGYFEPVIHEGKGYFRAYLSSKKRKLLGFAFKAEAQGYAGPIETMAAIDTKGRIVGVKILAQNETPGLGAKIDEVLVKKTLWQAIREAFRDKKESPQISSGPLFCEQFKGKEIKDLVVVKKPTKKNIQAITGATISSEALTNSVRKAAEEILEYE